MEFNDSDSDKYKGTQQILNRLLEQIRKDSDIIPSAGTLRASGWYALIRKKSKIMEEEKKQIRIDFKSYAKRWCIFNDKSSKYPEVLKDLENCIKTYMLSNGYENWEDDDYEEIVDILQPCFKIVFN